MGGLTLAELAEVRAELKPNDTRGPLLSFPRSLQETLLSHSFEATDDVRGGLPI
jgi:hypothetical protein